MNYNLLLNKIALEYNLPTAVVKKIVESQFEFVAEKIKELNFNDVKSEEEFNSMKTNFNIKYLFNIYPKYSVFKYIKQNETRNKSN